MSGLRLTSATVLVLGLNRPGIAAGADLRPVDFGTRVVPVVEKYCIGCHNSPKKKGDLLLDVYRKGGETAALADLAVWQGVAERVAAREMPPRDQPQPTAAEIDIVTSWVDQASRLRVPLGSRDPGRVTIRRLNRAEYNNTVRDLFGVELRPARDFPSDDVGYGFDNIGDVLSMPPALVERYLAAAERIADRVIVADLAPRFRVQTFAIPRLVPTPVGSVIRDGALVLSTNSAVRTPHTFPVDGAYRLRVRAFAGLRGKQPDKDPVRMTLRIDGSDVETVSVRATRGHPAVYTVQARVEAGSKRLELAFVNARGESRQLGLESLKIEGPLSPQPITPPESHRRLIPRPADQVAWRDDAREFLTAFATRAYRRPVTPAEVQRLVQFVEGAVADGETFERGMQVAVRAALVSPHFLFRGELVDADPASADNAVPVGDYALASRLSYFLWSSLPDNELFRLAREGKLHSDDVLAGQVRRMLQDPRSAALVDNFAPQWLQTRNLAGIRPSRKLFPAFNDELRAAMMKETELFFAAVMREDRSIFTFLDADFTFVNEPLARHYGIPGVEGREFQRVSLAGGSRGGVLTQASVLTVTSNPTRTSPVKRGRWVLEQLLGTPPPPPPPGVPQLKEPTDPGTPLAAATLRQLMEKHRADPNCATCHQKLDPLGFGLENFDAVGAWRDKDGDTLVDASGILPNGQLFRGPAALKAVLKSKGLLFRRALAQKMMTYALGRGTEVFDRPAIDDVCNAMIKDGDSFSSLIVAIARSEPFQKRRGRAASARGDPRGDQ